MRPFLLTVSVLAVMVTQGPIPVSALESPTRVSVSSAAAVDDACSASHRRWDAAELSKDWNGERRAAFDRLLIAADAFARAVALHETDHGAMAEGCAIPTAEAAERHVFRHTLDSIVTDLRPRTSPMTFREADGALNAAYREVMAVDNQQDLAWGSVDKTGIRAAERAWLAYRDAFVAFAATLDAPEAAERLAIDLTMRRTASLEAFLAD